MLYRISTRFLNTVMALAILYAAPMAYAEDTAPEVEIDWHVLEALGDSMSSRNPAPALTPPPARNWQPSLTAPAEQSRPARAAPPAPVTQPVVKAPPPQPRKKIVSKPVPMPAMEKPVVPARKAESFPVYSTIRTESSNPALSPTKQTRLPTADEAILPLPGEEPPVSPPAPAAAPAAATAPSVTTKITETGTVPRPGRKPVTAAHEKPVAPAKKIKVAAAAPATKRESDAPPLPRRRPDIQKASSSFVAQARTQAALKTAAVQNTPAIAPKIVKSEGPPVAALPAENVKAETLEGQIVTPSKQDLVKAIEQIGSGNKLALFRKKSASPPPEKPAPVIEKTEATSLSRASGNTDEAIDITSGPAETASAGSAIDITAEGANDITETKSGTNSKAKNKTKIEPKTQKTAARAPETSSTGAAVPRLPPPPEDKFEEEYISLKYEAGASEPDKQAQEKLENDILALLRDNPGWRVQIQAFASPAGEGVSNARRISLARALAIRTWLLDQGIEAGRMDVRALGAESDRQPLDRVDMVFYDRKTG